ncbi:MacB family efflux pump subunit [Moraxella sp. ZY210820]|uniref:MacB family efflux pump subunit n=1 Tax=unclassified Moraxella TaxID=2685852 RepID=UPI002731ADD2|nr:MacB family efflux pump subunit [Moraxella sp. ZY210820]WLF84636.1 MacB family efflux pump subunit [Moraxella sp. ZY210820]
MTDIESISAPSARPLLEVKQLVREFPAGEQTVQILKGIDLKIYAGELVAIVGQSGSGKSTLMNILGCLDKPTTGSYLVNGRETQQLTADELAQLRREYFGFIFQRYHLLGDLTASGNVEVPAVYAGIEAEQRHQRSAELLSELGLGERLHHRPNQLSGGQQQRVSIARALMNGGDVILADEPTGALDKKSGIEVMRILRELNAKGHTIILVTHDANVAKNATRIIEISDGMIISDRANVPENIYQQEEVSPETKLENTSVTSTQTQIQSTSRTQHKPNINAWRAFIDRFSEAFHMALLAMNAHRMRTFLTMLGIIIGIASVVSVVALGNGTQQKILDDISSMGTNTITVFQGRGFGDNSRTANRRTLVPADADALAQQPYVEAVSPLVTTSLTARHQQTEATANIQGVSADYFNVQGLNFAQGQAFNQSDTLQLAQNAVIDENTRKAFFANSDPIGQVIFLGKLPVRIVGVLQAEKKSMMSSDSLTVYLPYSTVMSRILGQAHVRNIVVRIKDEYPSAVAENAILALLEQRHNAQDVFTQNADSIREMVEETTQTMTLLVSAIAVISLVVGGIGVMNIMLVSVTERTQEIGVRMAVGARQSDILQQFLIEAVLVCLIGGILGVLFAFAVGQVFNTMAGGEFMMAYSTTSIISAFICSSLIGIIFGFLPANNASKLDPVVALSRE